MNHKHNKFDNKQKIRPFFVFFVNKGCSFEVELPQVITAVGLGLMDVTRPIQSVGIYWVGVNA